MAYAQNIPTQPVGFPGRRSIRIALVVFAGLVLVATAILGFSVVTYDDPAPAVQYPAPSAVDDLMAAKQAGRVARSSAPAVRYPAPSAMDDLMAAKQAGRVARAEALIEEWKDAVRENPGTLGKSARFTFEG